MNNKEMIISIYDNCYHIQFLINGKNLQKDEQLKICKLFDYGGNCNQCEGETYEMNQNYYIQEVMNKYDVDRIIVCNNGSIEIYERN